MIGMVRRSTPVFTTSWAARRSCMALRSIGCGKEDLGEITHHDGISPAWPISYEEIEPYYTKAEQVYQVHGARGEDPTEPPASAPYSFPAVSHEPRMQQLSDDLVRDGYRPFHSPNGIMLNEQNMPYSACVRCDDCDGFPCLVHAKSDAEVAGCACAAVAERHAGDPRRGRETQYQRGRHCGHGGGRAPSWGDGILP